LRFRHAQHLAGVGGVLQVGHDAIGQGDELLDRGALAFLVLQLHVLGLVGFPLDQLGLHPLQAGGVGGGELLHGLHHLAHLGQVGHGFLRLVQHVGHAGGVPQVGIHAGQLDQLAAHRGHGAGLGQHRLGELGVAGGGGQHLHQGGEVLGGLQGLVVQGAGGGRVDLVHGAGQGDQVGGTAVLGGALVDGFHRPGRVAALGQHPGQAGEVAGAAGLGLDLVGHLAEQGGVVQFGHHAGQAVQFLGGGDFLQRPGQGLGGGGRVGQGQPLAHAHGHLLAVAVHGEVGALAQHFLGLARVAQGRVADGQGDEDPW
jgi:hypothetical protein